MKKIILILLLSILIMPVVSVSAEVMAREIDVYLYHEYSDCIFFINWENTEQTATIQIQSPDGAIIDSSLQNTVFSRGGAAVSVGSAKSGYWTLRVTGKSLGYISISGGNKDISTTQYNAIQSFDVDIVNGYLNFKWNVVTTQDIINVSIIATQGANKNHAIWNDYSANKKGSTSFSIDELQTGLYSFIIQVYDGSTEYTLTTDKPLYVKQSNAPAKLDNVRVGSVDGEMFATWNPNSDDLYYITIYDYETLSIIKTEYVYSNYYTIKLTKEMDRVKFSVVAVDNYVFGEFDVFEIIQSIPNGIITFPNYSVTRESVVQINIDCLNDVTAGVYLNGVLLIENESAGDYDLTLSEGTHEVVAYIKDSYGNFKTFSKSITVDKTPPILNLNIDDSTKTASNNILVGGSTEPNAVISINGIEQELGAGSFMAKLALVNGINPITVSAYDSAGNKSVQTITVERAVSFGNIWTTFILPGVIFIFLTVWHIYLNKKDKEVNAE